MGITEPFTRELGYRDVRTPVNPAAGANYTLSIGDVRGDYVRVVAVKASLATDANVANRFFALDYLVRGAAYSIRNGAAAVTTASTTARVFQWDRAHTVSDFAANTPVFMPLVDLILIPGDSLQLTVDSIQAGDQISGIVIALECFYADSLAPSGG